MTKHLSILVSLFLSIGVWAQGYEPQQVEMDSPPKSIYFKTNPFTILQGPIPFTAEYRFGIEVMGSRRLSYQFMASYLNKSPFFSLGFQPNGSFTARDFEFPGYRLQAQVRYFALKFSSEHKVSTMMIPSGIYFGLQGSYAAATLKFKSFSYPRQEWTNFNVAAMSGIQYMISDIVGLDVFFGLGYKNNTIVDVQSSQQRTVMDPKQLVGNYYGNPVKLYLGFNMTFGLF